MRLGSSVVIGTIVDLAIGTKLGRVITGVLMVILAAIGFRVWLAAHDANTRHAALVGYVQQAALDAAEAENTEIKRQLAAGRKAAEQFAALLAEAQAKERDTDAATEKRIADYEKKLAAKGRSCKLDGDDIEFLRHP